MSTHQQCSKCGSTKIIQNARIIDRAYAFTTDLTVTVDAHPDALLLKNSTKAKTSARICGECGYMEMFAENPGELYSTYLRSKPV